MTKYIDLIGYPLKHSISQAFQQAALSYCKIDAYYSPRETQPDQLILAIDQLRLPDHMGANITVPYKEEVISLIDDIDEQSKVYGAINTIVNRNGKLTGYNTDAHGFLRALKNEPEFKLEGKRVLILGAGGVARAVSFALIQRKILSLYIMNRTVERAQNLVDSLATHVNENQLPVKVEVLLSNDDARNHVIFDSQLIVNCTTMGMRYSPNEFVSPLAKHLIPPDALVYDLVYNPLQTTLLKLAKEAGARTLDGLPMLVYQGAAGFELWTQKLAPIDIMFETAKQQLNR